MSVSILCHPSIMVVSTSRHKIFDQNEIYNIAQIDHIETIKLIPCYCLQCVMSSQNSCVVVRVNVLASGQVYVMSTQSSCVVVCVNVLASGQVEVSRDTNLDCFLW